MLSEEEPLNGLGYVSCGLCSMYSQVLVVTTDDEGRQIYSDEGLPVLHMDNELTSQDMFAHVADKHPEFA
jgi:hypothetical protein